MKSIVNNTYNTFNAVSVDYNYDLLGKKHFARLISFNAKGKVILILELTKKIGNLEDEFKIIENSIEIN